MGNSIEKALQEAVAKAETSEDTATQELSGRMKKLMARKINQQRRKRSGPLPKSLRKQK
jgi:hypothetical protein